MRLTSTLLPVSLALHLIVLPGLVRADDVSQADPFRPVQPSWDATESVEAPAKPNSKAAPAKPTPSENEQFPFELKDEPAPEEETDTLTAEEPTQTPIVAPVSPSGTTPVRDVDLHMPHVWMVSGAVVIGVSFFAALAIATQLDEPDLAGAAIGLGGLVGLAGLSVGVITQNQRLEAAGQRVPPALPNGIALNLAFRR